MQRITRYSLLFRQILHYTSKENPHYDAALIALQLSEELVEKINGSIKEKQSERKMEELKAKIDLEIPDEVFCF
jgi:hypothetical protein